MLFNKLYVVMANLPTYVLGAIGEHQTLSRLLLLGYNAAITNLSVENTESTDILCRDSKGRFCAIQVKTTSEDNWKTGISHKEFFDKKGQIDLEKGRKFLENKVVGPWVFVQVGVSSVIPTFNFFVLSRSEVIDMIYSNEEWYLTGYNRKKPLKGTGPICLYAPWLSGNGVPANNNHIEWVNPFSSPNYKFEEAWHNLWID